LEKRSELQLASDSIPLRDASKASTREGLPHQTTSTMRSRKM